MSNITRGRKKVNKDETDTLIFSQTSPDFIPKDTYVAQAALLMSKVKMSLGSSGGIELFYNIVRVAISAILACQGAPFYSLFF